ncbi:MAG TPA: replication initiator protein A [Rubrobacteraceae bacterium]|nr:replication initiator protein A [Rubrobacteraceae bacterium]
MTELRSNEPLQRMLEGWAEENGRSDLLVPAEFNHELFPLASTAMDPTENLLSFTLKTVQSDGRLVERTLEVEGSPRLGLPGLFDQEVYAGVLALLERKGGMPEDGTLRFSLYELKEILRLPTNADNYRRLRDSLFRWQRTSLTTQGAVYLADSEEYAVGEGYNIWSFRWARDSRPGRAKTELNELKFHEYFIRNYQAGYIKRIDWDFWLSLGRGTRGGTLKRLYRLIDAQRAGTLEWRTTVPNLMAQVPVPPSYKYPGKARDYLKRHHPDLVKRGFLKDVEISADYEVLYRVDEHFVNRQRHLGLAEDPRDRSAIERLMSFKVRENVARNLVAMRGAALCHRYMDAVPHQKDVRRPAGWLKTYIEGDHNGSYPPKHGFAPASADASARPAVLPKAARPSVAPKDHKEGYEWLFGEDDPAVEPSPPTADEAGWSETISAAEAVQKRRRSGEFDQAIRNFETLPYEEYTKWVTAPSPVVDASGNKFFVSADADLFVYVGGDGPDHRVLVKRLDRPDLA